jgi:hypothetical protein
MVTVWGSGSMIQVLQEDEFEVSRNDLVIAVGGRTHVEVAVDELVPGTSLGQHPVVFNGQRWRMRPDGHNRSLRPGNLPCQGRGRECHKCHKRKNATNDGRSLRCGLGDNLQLVPLGRCQTRKNASFVSSLMALT